MILFIPEIDEPVIIIRKEIENECPRCARKVLKHIKIKSRRCIVKYIPPPKVVTVGIVNIDIQTLKTIHKDEDMINEMLSLRKELAMMKKLKIEKKERKRKEKLKLPETDLPGYSK